MGRLSFFLPLLKENIIGELRQDLLQSATLFVISSEKILLSFALINQNTMLKVISFSFSNLEYCNSKRVSTTIGGNFSFANCKYQHCPLATVFPLVSVMNYKCQKSEIICTNDKLTFVH